LGRAGPLTVGLTVTEMVNAAGENKVRALLVMARTRWLPILISTMLATAWRKPSFLVVMDIFLSETAQLAHVVLPSASFAEKDGTFTGTDRRVQRVRKAIEPIGDALPDWQIICNLAGKMGASGFDFESPRQVMEEIARLTPATAASIMTGWTNWAACSGPAPPPITRHSLLAQREIRSRRG